MNTNETIPEIVADMRTKYPPAPNCVPTVTGQYVHDEMTWLADRIEAAAARMEQHAQNHATRHAEAVAAGNCRDCVLRGGIAATMREALGKLRAGLWNSSVIAGKRRLELYEIADAAIASAARQSPFKESEVAK